MILRIPLEPAPTKALAHGKKKLVSISLAQASLEVRVQALVESMGFRIAEDVEGIIDIAIADRPDILQASKASYKIFVTTDAPVSPDAGFVAVPASEILDRLPDHMREFGHD